MAAGDGTLTEAGTVLGTAAYISPEQAAGAPASEASDVYSFGVILYRMLTGRLPFESSDPMQLVMQHRDDTPPPIASLRADAPAALESTANAALAKDPRDRPPNGGALLAELGVPAGASLTTAPTAVVAEDATQVLRAAPAAAAVEAYPDAAAGAQPAADHRRCAARARRRRRRARLRGDAAPSAPGDTGTFTPITLPSQSQTTATSGPTTTADTTTTTEQTTTQTTTTTTSRRRRLRRRPPPHRRRRPHRRRQPRRPTTAPPTTTTDLTTTTTAP